MNEKNSTQEKIKIKKLNEVLTSSSRILKIVYVVSVILSIWIITLIFKEWHVFEFIINILEVLSPLFIGFLVAWLCDPLVTFLENKGMRRGLGAALTYVVVLFLLYLLFSYMVPVLTTQINEFAKSLPQMGHDIGIWTTDTINKIGDGKFRVNVNEVNLKINLIFKELTGALTLNFEEVTVSIFKSIFSVGGAILVGLIIGFYLLVDFKRVSKNLVNFFPKVARKDASNLIKLVNGKLRRWILGVGLDSLCIFIISSIVLAIVGVPAPLLFGLFCGITNVIPYAGPYIGGIPAVIVGFSQGLGSGIGALVSIIIIQFIEGNFIAPLIIGKTMKLHPVTIIVGLLIFGSWFGMIGMIISTPIIASGKILLEYFDEKYDIFSWHNKEVVAKKKVTLVKKSNKGA